MYTINKAHESFTFFVHILFYIPQRRTNAMLMILFFSPPSIHISTTPQSAWSAFQFSCIWLHASPTYPSKHEHWPVSTSHIPLFAHSDTTW